MNSPRSLRLLAFLAVLALLAVQEVRFRRTLGRLRAEFAASAGGRLEEFFKGHHLRVVLPEEVGQMWTLPGGFLKKNSTGQNLRF